MLALKMAISLVMAFGKQLVETKRSSFNLTAGGTKHALRLLLRRGADSACRHVAGRDVCEACL